MKAVGIVSRHDPARMIEQLEQCMELGFKSVTVRPEPIKGRYFGHKDNHPFFKACADNNIAVLIHSGSHLYGNTVGSDRFDTRFGIHTCSHPMEMQMGFLALLESGILQDNPRLKVGLLEGGCAWIPYWLWRMDNICHPEVPELVAKTMPKKPSEYFKQHCWVTVEPGEPCIDEVIRIVGHERLIFGTDFPHLDHLDLEPEHLFDKSLQLTDEQLKDIFERNPLALFEG